MDSRGDAEARRRQEVEPEIDVHQVGDPSITLAQRESTVFSAPPREKSNATFRVNLPSKDLPPANKNPHGIAVGVGATSVDRRSQALAALPAPAFFTAAWRAATLSVFSHEKPSRPKWPW